MTSDSGDASVTLARVEVQINNLATASVLRGWRWWRPAYSSGYHDGLTAAAAIALEARLEDVALPSPDSPATP